MPRKRGLLAKMDSARVSEWVDSFGGISGRRDSIDEMLDPGRRQIARLTDEELAELLARHPSTKESQLAASEMRRRESWRTPARWAVLISLLSFALALVAFIRTL